MIAPRSQPGGTINGNTDRTRRLSQPYVRLGANHPPRPSWRCVSCRVDDRQICWTAIRLDLGGRRPVDWRELQACGIDPITGDPIDVPRCRTAT